MKRSLWFLHPIAILIFSIVALGLSLFLYIYWYVGVSSGLQNVLEKNNLDTQQFVAWQTWVVILILSILVGLILLGIFTIFAYQRKTLALYRSQHKFINSFTHELKTPTTSLRLYLETFVKHDIPRDQQLKYLNYMLEDVDRLSDNINGILDLARIEAKIYRGECVSVNLLEEVEFFCIENEQLFRGSEIQIEKNESQSYCSSINRSLFQMLLMNIISNGIRYNKNSCPKIMISFSQSEKNVIVRFKDNGIGFEKSYVKKIFKKFFQVDREDWSQTGGTGLGLYMVEQVAKFHKGKIVAQSDGPDKGAQFTLSLPRHKQMDLESDMTSSASAKKLAVELNKESINRKY